MRIIDENKTAKSGERCRITEEKVFPLSNGFRALGHTHAHTPKELNPDSPQSLTLTRVMSFTCGVCVCWNKATFVLLQTLAYTAHVQNDPNKDIFKLELDL